MRLIDDQEVDEPSCSGFRREDLVKEALHPRRAQPLQADDSSGVHGEGVGFQAM